MVQRLSPSGDVCPPPGTLRSLADGVTEPETRIIRIAPTSSRAISPTKAGVATMTSPSFDLMMRRNGWKPDGEAWERNGLTAYARLLVRPDGGLSVFVGRKDGGGSLNLKKSNDTQKMIDEATEFAR